MPLVARIESFPYLIMFLQVDHQYTYVVSGPPFPCAFHQWFNCTLFQLSFLLSVLQFAASPIMSPSLSDALSHTPSDATRSDSSSPFRQNELSSGLEINNSSNSKSPIALEAAQTLFKRFVLRTSTTSLKADSTRSSLSFHRSIWSS